MSLPWLKMWVEALDDPKITKLSLAERGAWWGLLKLTRKCEDGGKAGRIVSGGQGLSIEDIADSLHIKTNEDRQALEYMITKMEKRGSLKWNHGMLTVVHFEERQKVPASARPENVAKRVRDFRDRQKGIATDAPRQQISAITEMVGRELFISGQSIEKAKSIARGEFSGVSEGKRQIFIDELKRLGIPLTGEGKLEVKNGTGKGAENS